ncbi:ATP-dependent DNA helicase [Candidatus Similichlamydia laticola]|uniref:Exodeoxyribonuclease V alpha chain RecD n=1 Tax=Candidatus Similichlamydia laticola TaxID=2170265 RepID=A0A369KEN6_9BACT|nr:AAA family ATPase [Candidatus Similichlamydia laticola]RDB31145.1 Exodeoxyribonuclease V alpha chain RecD [Candidatus Similichlamydia laticola]
MLDNPEKPWMVLCSYLDKKTIHLAKSWDSQGDDGHPLLAFVFKAARAGHFCVRITGQSVYPSIYDLVEEELLEQDEAFLERLEAWIRKGREASPSWLGSFWSPFSPILLYRVGDYFLLPRFMGVLDTLLHQITRLSQAPCFLSWAKVPCPAVLNPEQQVCFESVQRQAVHFLLGGPGTGKSFTAVAVIQLALSSGFRVAVLAPTGKAVANLKKRFSSTETCFFGTIHRALGLSHSSPLRSRMNPIPYDFILVDECSMIDALLFAELLQAIPTGARVLFMGDMNQLPSIEMDGAFSLLVEWGKRYQLVTQLETSVRMETEGLGALTQHVLTGDRELCFALLQEDPSLRWIEQPVVSDWFEEICSLFGEELKKWLWASEEQAFILMDTLKVLVPIRVGESGSERANLSITLWMCRQARQRGIDTFYMPVFVTKNFPSEGLCNGDQGLIQVHVQEALDPLTKRRVTFLYREESGDFLKKEMSSYDLSYGWCISVHKSQGSEFDHVVVILPKASSRLLNRQLLYTALTRAKKGITLWAHRSELDLALSKSLLRSESGLMRVFDQGDCSIGRMI